jgi:5-oxoprolinase (ATP-hydrolysing)
MAAAVRLLSTAQGRSLENAALVAFGGAGGLLACPLAAVLGMKRVLTHPLGGLLSAWGIGLAQGRTLRRTTIRVGLHDPSARRTVSDALSCDAARSSCHIHLAVPDWDRSIVLPEALLNDPEAAHVAFREACMQRYGWDPGNESPVITAVQEETIEPPRLGPRESAAFRGSLPKGEVLCGPRVVKHPGSTVFIDANWTGIVLDNGTLQLDCISVHQASDVSEASVTLLAHRMQAIAEEMGALLRFTARSVNIRERLDYSCAIFTPDGALIANGPHMPVHLGSMGASVQHVLKACPSLLGPGDAVLLNDPYRGGTHLPDLTIVSAVFDAHGERIAMVASRGHHSDVGGITPGSMPPNATTLAQEGVVIDALSIVRDGAFNEAAVRSVLASGPWPCRAPDRVVDDLRAQLAANQRGRVAVEALAASLGTRALSALMAGVLDQGEALVRRCLSSLHGGQASMPIDGGGAIEVVLRCEGDEVEVDFTGTAPQSGGNSNAPEAVTRAALLYVLRCLVDDVIPLNDGCLRPVRLILPKGSILSPAQGAAVAGGNVETSQLVVDALLSAFGVQSASQGSMNNVAFGDDTLQHYETVCGGTGAGPYFDGAHCVQSHMTNSRLTDPEILERRFPVRLWQLQRRLGSGGHGAHRGGDGVVRMFECLAPLQVSLLSGRRETVPPGCLGGLAGSAGMQRVVHEDGTVEVLGGRFVLHAKAGDRVVIETPGGGGFGAPLVKPAE